MHINAIVLTTRDLPLAVTFYRALGVPLEDEHHEDGPQHYACEMEGVHFALYAAKRESPSLPPRGATGATLVGFAVHDLEATLTTLTALGAVTEVAPETVPWGRRAIVLDPDGRLVELNEAPAV
jgi:lactoylglutathione lyase